MSAAFEGWAIVELMGHRKLAGHCSEATIAGAPFLRIDVPSEPPVTQFYGGSAIYCVTPTTEEIARKVGAASRPTPIHAYELPAARTPVEDEDETSQSTTTQPPYDPDDEI